MIDPELLRAIRLIALEEISEGTYEAFYRKTCRWYSKTFYTPLAQVMDMAEEELFRVYFEDSIQGVKALGEEKFLEYMKEVVEDEMQNASPEEAAEKDANDDEWYEEELRKIKEADDKNATKNEYLAEKPNLFKEEDSGTFVFTGEDSPEDE